MKADFASRLGPIFRTDDLMQLFRNAVIPSVSGRARSPPPPPRGGGSFLTAWPGIFSLILIVQLEDRHQIMDRIRVLEAENVDTDVVLTLLAPLAKTESHVKVVSVEVHSCNLGFFPSRVDESLWK